MSDRIARAVAGAHEGLSVAAHRLAAGHRTLVGAVTERPVWWPAPARSGDDEKPAPEKEPTDADTKKTDADTEKTDTAPKTKRQKNAAEKDQKDKKKQPPVHTTYRLGPRRALAAALHWTTGGDGAADFLVRAGLLAGGIGVLGYLARPLVAPLHPAALCTIAVILVVYEVSPRLSALLSIGLVIALVGPRWLGLALIVFLAVEVAPVLAALLVVGLAAAATHPALMWPVAFGWMTAAWCAGAPEAETAEKDVQEEEEPEPEPAGDWGTALLWHVVRALATAESAGRAGLHLDTILDSAIADGLLAEGIDLPAFRSWVEACGLPTEDKVGMRIGGKPVTRVGLKMAAVTEALGMTPTALVQARSQTPPTSLPAAPARPADDGVPEEVAMAPAEALAAPSAPAPLRLIPGGRRAPVNAPSPEPAAEAAHGAR